MGIMKLKNFDDFLENELSRPEVRKEYEALEEEYQLAAELIKLRQKAGLTQRDLAKKVKTSQPCIARLESGRYQNVSMAFLRKVSRALGVEPHISFRRARGAH
jgi:ribosome-binding protein aMBF1 (putative translation factor)